MRVQTKTEITINTSMTTSVNAVLCMEIYQYGYNSEFEALEALGVYYYVDGEVKIPLKQFTFSATPDEVNALYDSITPPAFTNKVAFDKEVAYMGGLKVMAQEYSISEDNLEIVIEEE